MKGLWGWNPQHSPPPQRPGEDSHSHLDPLEPSDPLQPVLEPLEPDMPHIRKPRGRADNTFTPDKMFLMMVDHIPKDWLAECQIKGYMFGEKNPDNQMKKFESLLAACLQESPHGFFNKIPVQQGLETFAGEHTEHTLNSKLSFRVQAMYFCGFTHKLRETKRSMTTGVRLDPHIARLVALITESSEHFNVLYSNKCMWYFETCILFKFDINQVKLASVNIKQRNKPVNKLSLSLEQQRTQARHIKRRLCQTDDYNECLRHHLHALQQWQRPTLKGLIMCNGKNLGKQINSFLIIQPDHLNGATMVTNQNTQTTLLKMTASWPEFGDWTRNQMCFSNIVQKLLSWNT